MCFHCCSERLVLVGCHCPRTGMGPNAAPCCGCSQHIRAPDMLVPALTTLLGSSLTRAAPFGHPLVSAAYFGTVSGGSALPLLISCPASLDG